MAPAQRDSGMPPAYWPDRDTARVMAEVGLSPNSAVGHSCSYLTKALLNNTLDFISPKLIKMSSNYFIL